MMMMMTVTTAMGASTAAMIHRLLGGFFTTAVGKSQREAHDKEHWEGEGHWREISLHPPVPSRGMVKRIWDQKDSCLGQVTQGL